MQLAEHPNERLETEVAGYRASSMPKKIVSSPLSAPSSLRKLCLWLSNAILQFPIMFEIQQKSLSQPTLLRREVEEELAVLSKTHNDQFLVLDYGCGSGTYSGLFDYDKYLGIDCNEEMLKRAAQNNPKHSFVHAHDLTGIGESLDSVVHVLMVGVIHHLSEPDLIDILSTIPKDKTVKLLAIDTLKCDSGIGKLVQLFERGEFLRNEQEHKKLLDRVAETTSFKKVGYGRAFELAVFRGVLRKTIA